MARRGLGLASQDKDLKLKLLASIAKHSDRRHERFAICMRLHGPHLTCKS